MDVRDDPARAHVRSGEKSVRLELPDGGAGITGISCEHGNSLTVEVGNNCDRPLKVQICIELRDRGLQCNSNAMVVGEKWLPHECGDVTG